MKPNHSIVQQIATQFTQILGEGTFSNGNSKGEGQEAEV